MASNIDRYDSRPHFWFDMQGKDRILDHVRIAPARVIKVMTQKMEKGQDGKQVIFHRCKFFFNENDAQAYWDAIEKYHNDGRLKVLRRGRLIGGWQCPESMRTDEPGI